MVRIRHSWAEILESMRRDVPLNIAGTNLSECELITAYQGDKLSDDAYLGALAQKLQIDAQDAATAHGLVLLEDYPGAADLVREIQAKGIPAVCLSNTNALHFREFFAGRFPVCETFDLLLSSHEVGASKPEPAIYQAMEDRLGFSGDQIAFFDDLPANVAGARKMGWRAEVVDPSGDPPGTIREILREWSVL